MKTRVVVLTLAVFSFTGCGPDSYAEDERHAELVSLVSDLCREAHGLAAVPVISPDGSHSPLVIATAELANDPRFDEAGDLQRELEIEYGDEVEPRPIALESGLGLVVDAYEVAVDRYFEDNPTSEQAGSGDIGELVMGYQLAEVESWCQSGDEITLHSTLVDALVDREDF